MENNKTNELKKKNSFNMNYIIVAVIIVIVLILGLLLIKGCSKKDSSNNENNEEKVIEKKAVDESDLVESYGMSKEDAINIVKTAYNGDIYEFSAEINKDSKYIVTVKNLVTNTESKFLVDPTSTSKSFYMLDE